MWFCSMSVVVRLRAVSRRRKHRRQTGHCYCRIMTSNGVGDGARKLLHSRQDESRDDTKPELEIYADDVACSHGSTSGAIDEEALFYLCSRGVPKDQATDLLTLAFLAEAVDEIESDTLSDRKGGCCCFQPL